MTREEHIAEINKILQDNKRLKEMLGTQNNLLSAMRDYTSADVEEAYNRGYQDGAQNPTSMGYEHGYEAGLNDAWDAVGKLAKMDTLTSSRITGHFGLFAIMNNLKPQEAVQKIAEYEKQKNEEIKVGDELLFNDYVKGVVVALEEWEDQTKYCVLNENGLCEWVDLRNYDVKKTGRTFPQISEVLKAMRGES